MTAWDASDGLSSYVVYKSTINASYCLDVRGGTANGSEHLQLSTCRTGATSQTFVMANGTIGSGWFLETPICTQISHNRMGIDIPLPLQSSGYVQQYRRNGGSNQLWYFYDVATGTWLKWQDSLQRIRC